MGTRGTGVYVPGIDFHFPRSFITDVVIARNGTNVTQHDNVFDLDLLPLSPAIFRCTFHPNFWFWNSNDWTIDYVITESWYKPTGVGPEVPLNFLLTWSRYPAGTPSTLFWIPSSSFVDPQRFTLPPPPSNYWSPAS